MSGELNGVQAQVLGSFPYAYYNHFVAHRMSLCASQTSKNITEVSDFFNVTDSIISFVRCSPKRTHLLGCNLPKPGDTRWLSRDTAICAVDTSYEEIGTVLHEMARGTDEKAEVRAVARGLCLSIQQIKFTFLLKRYRKIFEYYGPVLKMMQRPTLAPVQLSSMIIDFKGLLEGLNLD